MDWIFYHSGENEWMTVKGSNLCQLQTFHPCIILDSRHSTIFQHIPVSWHPVLANLHWKSRKTVRAFRIENKVFFSTLHMSVVGFHGGPWHSLIFSFWPPMFVIGIQMATACCLTGIHLCDIYCNWKVSDGKTLYLSNSIQPSSSSCQEPGAATQCSSKWRSLELKFVGDPDLSIYHPSEHWSLI